MYCYTCHFSAEGKGKKTRKGTSSILLKEYKHENKHYCKFKELVQSWRALKFVEARNTAAFVSKRTPAECLKSPTAWSLVEINEKREREKSRAIFRVFLPSFYYF